MHICKNVKGLLSIQWSYFISFRVQPVDKHVGPGVERLPKLCDLLPTVRGEEEVDDVVIEVLLATQVLIDEAADDGGPVGELHHFGLVFQLLHDPLAVRRLAGPVESLEHDEEASAAARRHGASLR